MFVVVRKEWCVTETEWIQRVPEWYGMPSPKRITSSGDPAISWALFRTRSESWGKLRNGCDWLLLC
jgi:hypothetical protein